MDTSVLVAGIAGLKRRDLTPVTPSARLLRDWIERGTFTWLVSSEILEEYRQVLARLGVRPATIGRVMNLLGEEAEVVEPGRSRDVSPDPTDEPFCACSISGNADFIVTLNPADFPQSRLRARVLAPGQPLTKLTSRSLPNRRRSR